jgi:hypothetical protein
MKISLLGIAAAATLAALPAGATTVYTSGTFVSVGELGGGTFSGSFDMEFPTDDTESLSVFDIVIQSANESFEIDNNQPNSEAVYYDQDLTGEGALLIDFVDLANLNAIDLFFDEPFTGNAPAVPVTSIGDLSEAEFGSTKATAIASGVASTTPLAEASPEPSTCCLTGAAGLLALLLRRRVR